MKPHLFVDTNYFCALYNKQDTLHDKAKNIAPAIETFFLVTSNFVLLETYTILSQRVSRDEAIWFGNNIVPKTLSVTYWIDQQFEKEAWKTFMTTKDKDFSYVDASTLAIMQKEKVSHLLSFDRGFKGLEKRFRFTLIP